MRRLLEENICGTVWSRAKKKQMKKKWQQQRKHVLHIVYYENGASLIILDGTYLPSFGAFP